MSHRKVQWCPAIQCDGINICARNQQQPRNFGQSIGTGDREHKRRPPLTIAGVHICSDVDQSGNDVRTGTVLCRILEHTTTNTTPRMHVGSGLDKDANRFRIGVTTRGMEQRGHVHAVTCMRIGSRSKQP